MRLAPAPLVAALLLTIAPAARAADDLPASPGTSPGGRHCFGAPRPRWLGSATLIGEANPTGVEVQLQAGRCLPLITTPGALFDYTNFQYGLAAYLAPVYAMPGAFISIAPLSVIELRAEVEYVGQWPVGLDGAGYFPLSSAEAPWDTLPADAATTAQGYTANFTANLQAEIPLAARWSLLALDSASWQFWQLGTAAAYYNTRYDLPMARRDWILKNTALVLANHDLSERVKLRGGVTLDQSWVTGSGYRQDVVAGLLTGVIARWPGPGSETQPFLRLGGYTRHAYRQGELQLFVGVGMTFDLAPAPAR
jgi:hypothetical protein